MEKSRGFLGFYLVFGCIGWVISAICYFQPIKMDESLSLSYLQSSAWYQSRTVIAELHHLLSEKGTLSDDNYKMKLHNILNRQLVVFANDMDNAPSTIPLMGSRYRRAFLFTQYENDINQIATSAMVDDQAITQIADVMEFYQNKAITTMKQELLISQ